VLPTLEHDLNAVAVGVEDISGVVARVVIKASTRSAVIGSTCPDGSFIECVNLGFAVGDKANMNGPVVRPTQS
jgi:hypothetical protein